MLRGIFVRFFDEVENENFVEYLRSVKSLSGGIFFCFIKKSLLIFYLFHHFLKKAAKFLIYVYNDDNKYSHPFTDWCRIRCQMMQ